jgi:hypothetical protein
MNLNSSVADHILLAACGVVVTSCASLSGEAKSEFARAASCPPDRVTVEPRPGLQSPLLGESPPPDVAADPARVAFWRQQREAKRRELFGECEWFESSGCGRRDTYCCEHPSGDHGEVLMSSASCTPMSALLAALQPSMTLGKSYYGLELDGPAVSQVRAGSPGNQAGVLPGDVFLEVDHQLVSGSGIRVLELLRTEGATSHALRVQRGSQTVDLTIAAPASTAPTPPAAPGREDR